MSQAISEVLNPNRNPQEAFGMKAEATFDRITLNLSSVNPVNILKLAEFRHRSGQCCTHVQSECRRSREKHFRE